MNNSINDVWETIQENEYIIFDKEKNANKVNLTFIDDDPIQSMGKYGRKYDFQVIEVEDPEKVKTLSVTSNRLMLKLKDLRPLSNKTLSITRIGTGMDTDYTVVTYPQQNTLQ